MREVYDYYGHPLLEDVHSAVSSIVRILDKYGYVDKSLYVAQECLLDELICLETAAREYKEKAQRLRKQASEIAVNAKDGSGRIPHSVKHETKALYQEADEYDEARRVLQYGRWLLRYVGDGIAWHAYRHSRRIIRALASKESVPAIADFKGLESIRKLFRAVRRLGRDWLPVLHDLTNCLRTADLSIFQGGYLVRILELKIRKGRSEDEYSHQEQFHVDERSKRQEERLGRILHFMKTKDLGDLDPGLAGGKSLDSETYERHNFESVSKSMASARDRGYGFGSPEPGLLYVAWNVLETNIDIALSEAQVEHPEIFETKITFRSISARFEEYHQDLPITAMELSADDILDLIFGRIGVVAIINFKILERFCSEKGIPLSVESNVGGGFSLKVEVDGIKGEVWDGLWNRVMLEALSLESFAGLIRTIMESYYGRADSASA